MSNILGFDDWWKDYASNNPMEARNYGLGSALSGIYRETDPILRNKAYQKYGDYVYGLLDNSNAFEVQGILAKNGYRYSPEQYDFLNNAINQQNTQSARDFETQFRDTSTLSLGNQLSQLGLSGSSVLDASLGGSSGVGTALATGANPASDKYAQKMAVLKGMLNIAGMMAGAGVYSGLSAVKSAASKMAVNSAHSALSLPGIYGLSTPWKTSNTDFTWNPNDFSLFS